MTSYSGSPLLVCNILPLAVHTLGMNIRVSMRERKMIDNRAMAPWFSSKQRHKVQIGKPYWTGFTDVCNAKGGVRVVSVLFGRVLLCDVISFQGIQTRPMEYLQPPSLTLPTLSSPLFPPLSKTAYWPAP